ncbi:MAG: M13 family metallopeptidase [Rhodoluna sp.]
MGMKPGIEKEAFDLTVRVQDDLFRHVNGKWFNETEIPEDKSMYGSFHMLADDAEAAVKEILLEAAANPKPGAAQQIGDLYASFMDEARANELGVAPIAAELKLIEQLDSIDATTKLLGEFSKQGVGGLFGSYVDNDPGNPERYLVNLLQGGLGLPDEAYYRDPKHVEIRDAYLPHITQMFIYAGWSQADAESAAHKVFEFETALADLHWDVVDSRDAEKTYNLVALDELQKLTSTFNWSLWLQGAELDKKVLAESVVAQPSFFEGLASVYKTENLESIKAWLAWKLISGAAALLSEEFVNERFAFYGTKLTGAPVNRARWKRGVSLVEGSLGELIGKIYVEKYFPPAAKERMDKLVEYLIEAYRQSIKELDWMTDETKAKALVKLDKFTPKIGFPDKWKDYSKLEIVRDDLVGNVKRANAFEHEREAAKIGSPIDRDEWFMTPQTVNAYYNPGFNEIVFPAAILQPPFFSLEADDAENFGAIGAVIGHEIGHGFDDQGSKYDGDGALQSWWTDADRNAFEDRTKKLINQYNELSPLQLDDSHKVNGELTIGENIGDLGGLGIAYKAYLLSLDGKEAPTIDGSTAAQRFFFAWAQSWRAMGRDEVMIQRLATDPHSPPEFRCNQIVRNIDVFYDAFDVKPGDAEWLDEKERVVIW